MSEPMIRVWQITCKPGEYCPDEGRWLASKSVDGHIVGITRRSHFTPEAAEAAFNAWDDDREGKE